jgi:hypothetical protein
MKKIALSDGSGHWFDIEAARVWEERVDPDEEEHRKRNNPHEEKLYLSTHGTFILYRWHWSMAEDMYHEIDIERATRWLIANGYQREVPKLDLLPEERRLEL